MVALAAAVLAGSAGSVAGALVGGSVVAAFVAQGILVGAVALVVFVAIAAAADPRDVRPLLRRLAARARRTRQPSGDRTAGSENGERS